MRFALALVCLCAPRIADADEWLTWKRLTIRQTLDSKYVPKPASAHFIWNKDADNSWDVALAAKYSAFPDVVEQYALIGPTLEYQRNTLTGKEQNLLKAGLGADVDIGSPVDYWVVPNVVASGGYLRDDVKHTSGITAKGKLTLIVSGGETAADRWYRPNRYADLGVVGIQYSPFVGFEYDNALRAQMAADRGSIARVLAQGILGLYPAPAPLERKLEIVFDASYRYDAFGSLRMADRDHLLLSASVNYYFVKKQKTRVFGIGVDFVHGEDPDQRFADQDLIRFGAKGML